MAADLRYAKTCKRMFSGCSYDGRMKRETLNKLGLAAVILLAPGGFILGATLAANHYRKKAQAPSRRAAAGSETPETGDLDPARAE